MMEYSDMPESYDKLCETRMVVEVMLLDKKVLPSSGITIVLSTIVCHY